MRNVGSFRYVEKTRRIYVYYRLAFNPTNEDCFVIYGAHIYTMTKGEPSLCNQLLKQYAKIRYTNNPISVTINKSLLYTQPLKKTIRGLIHKHGVCRSANRAGHSGEPSTAPRDTQSRINPSDAGQIQDIARRVFSNSESHTVVSTLRTIIPHLSSLGINTTTLQSVLPEDDAEPDDSPFEVLMSLFRTGN